MKKILFATACTLLTMHMYAAEVIHEVLDGFPNSSIYFYRQGDLTTCSQKKHISRFHVTEVMYLAWEIGNSRMFSNEEARSLYKHLEKEFNAKTGNADKDEPENTQEEIVEDSPGLCARICCCLRKKRD